jgi:hypothetical protein
MDQKFHRLLWQLADIPIDSGLFKFRTVNMQRELHM